ncbi:MAG: nicotinate-nicotinamide nucleotide adenylyltransferase [Deltaproteobacteria bacterium]|nr:nicotinate-nicotinamide nucleotide adenylyltransferase [Deltaproteobacteria bacterium]
MSAVEGISDDDLRALDTFIPPLRGFGRIGLLGGSFNPPHLGHVMIAVAVYATEEIDHLWVIPTASHAFGQFDPSKQGLAPFDDRVRMCHLAFRHLAGGAAVLDIEKRLPSPNYTVNLLRALHFLRPGIKPVWIAGSDIIQDLPKWKEPEEFQRLCRLVVVPRRGYESGAKLGIDLPLLSSTDVRTLLREGRDVSGLIDREVLSFVERRELYK